MNKSKVLKHNFFSKNNIAIFLIAVMVFGFLCARALNSICIFLFTVNALRDVPPKDWLKARWWFIGLIWVGAYFISGFWSQEGGFWNPSVQTKLSFILLPLGFSFLPAWSEQDIRRVTVILSGLILSGILYSLSFYIKDFDALNHYYQQSKTMRTPAKNDHISFSVAIACTIGWCWYSIPYWHKKWQRSLVLLVSLFFAVYLHILAAKTGLLVFYVLLTCILARTMFYKPLVGLMLLLLVAGSATLAYQYIPTLRARIDYTVYSYSLYFKGERNADYSDQGRMISYDVGSHIIRQNPLLGVGAGDMIYEMGRGYRKMYPSVREDQYLIPHNQFMIIALAAGLPAMLAFLVWLVMPLFQIKSGRAGFYFVTIWLMLLVPLFTYPALEVQFGIFVFLLFLLLQKHVMDKPVEV